MGLTALITPIHVTEGSTRQMYLGPAIRSVLNQDHKVVHIIIDDASTIDIRSTVNRYGRKVRYLEERHYHMKREQLLMRAILDLDYVLVETPSYQAK